MLKLLTGGAAVDAVDDYVAVTDDDADDCCTYAVVCL